MTRDWKAVIGRDPAELCDELYAKKPTWSIGSISHFDARFLFKEALAVSPNVAVEIGTASGFSAAVLCLALSVAARAKAIAPDFRVLSYDISAEFYADPTRKVGDAARELLPPELLEHMLFTAPDGTALTLREHHDPDSIRFLFIDGDHRHPWPTLDLIAALDCLAAGAAVFLHDINLPVRMPDAADWGAKYLFDDLDVAKELPDDAGDVPNVGRVTIPTDKEQLRDQLLGILYAHPWEAKVSSHVTTRVLV